MKSILFNLYIIIVVSQNKKILHGRKEYEDFRRSQLIVTL